MMRLEPPRALPPGPSLAAAAAGLAGAVVLALAIGVSTHAIGPAVAVALGSAGLWLDMLARSGPLMLTGLAAALALRAGLFNFGGEGQMLAGMLAGFGAAKLLPAPLALPAALAAGTLAGAAMMAIAAALKVKRGVDDAVLTLLMNVVALSGFQLVAPSTAAQDLTAPLRAGVGAAIGIAACAVFYVVLRYTVIGFALRATGGNAAAARFAGIRAGRVMVVSGLVSGALAAFAGAALQGGLIGASGHPGTGLGYAGIAVAVLAAAEPRALLPAALAVGAVTTFLDAASRSGGINASMTDLVLGVAVVLTLAFRRIASRGVRP